MAELEVDIRQVVEGSPFECNQAAAAVGGSFVEEGNLVGLVVVVVVGEGMRRFVVMVVVDILHTLTEELVVEVGKLVEVEPAEDRPRFVVVVVDTLHILIGYPVEGTLCMVVEVEPLVGMQDLALDKVGVNPLHKGAVEGVLLRNCLFLLPCYVICILSCVFRLYNEILQAVL
jgi:hypothetical protein